jgi:hypothetical protein
MDLNKALLATAETVWQLRHQAPDEAFDTLADAAMELLLLAGLNRRDAGAVVEWADETSSTLPDALAAWRRAER